MARATQTQRRVDIYSDSSYSEDDKFVHGRLDSSKFSPLRNITVSHVQNYQPQTSPPKQIPSPEKSVEAITAELERLHIRDAREYNRVQGKPAHKRRPIGTGGNRLTRPITGNNPFELLETVPEDDKRGPSMSDGASVSDGCHRYIELPADQYAHHPLASAARNLRSVKDQISKHQNGEFEWVLTVRVPLPSNKDRSHKSSHSEQFAGTREAFFGCTLLPTSTPDKHDTPKEGFPATYTLLVTPLEEDEELLAAMTVSLREEFVSAPALAGKHATPNKISRRSPEVRVEEVSPVYTTSESSCEIFTSRTSARPPVRAENTIETLDETQERSDAFGDSAHFESNFSAEEQERPAKREVQRSERAKESPHSTPRPTRTNPAPGSSSRQGKTEMRDSPKLKGEDKTPVRASPAKSVGKPLKSLLPPKQLARSTKAPTVPSFQLPGEAVAQRLKEKREARLSAQASPEKLKASSAAPGLAKIKSAKPPTRPSFELPGEAISRRKREEREAKLKAQEEEDRQRRQFKARPIRSGSVYGAPRETLASLARQSRILGENSAQNDHSPVKRQSVMVSTREPFSSTHNQQQPLRGRSSMIESSAATRARRVTASTSTGDMSAKRASVSSFRDSVYAPDTMRTQRAREELARSAREQASERDRNLSRQWAEKQKRKQLRASTSSKNVAAS